MCNFDLIRLSFFVLLHLPINSATNILLLSKEAFPIIMPTIPAVHPLLKLSKKPSLRICPLGRVRIHLVHPFNMLRLYGLRSLPLMHFGVFGYFDFFYPDNIPPLEIVQILRRVQHIILHLCKSFLIDNSEFLRPS
jgi:hypothetical protein